MNKPEGEYQRLIHGSIEAKLEAVHMITENDQAVEQAVKQLQDVFLKAQSPDTAEGNDGKAGTGAAEQDWVDAAEASVTGAGAEASVSGV